MTKTGRTFSLALLAALLGLLLVLGPNLQRIVLGPGEEKPASALDLEIAGGALEASPIAEGAFQLIVRIVMIGALVGLAALIVGAIFSKRLRAYLTVFALLFLLAAAISYLPKPVAEPSGTSEQLLEPVEATQDVHPEGADRDAPPSWWSIAAAIGMSSLVVALLMLAWSRLAAGLRRRSEPPGPSEMEELLESVHSAADQIRLGGDPRAAVLRCYREMVRILCANRRIDYPHMTARELAGALSRAGFTADDVDRLTEIFELVRYGRRSAQPLADRAIGCLDAIRRAYGA